MSNITLEVNNLKVGYFSQEKTTIAVNDVSFKVFSGELLGLVGESGCGKTTTAMGIIQLIQNPGRLVGGEVLINQGKTNIANMNEKELRKIRWSEVSMIPQGAMNSLNPVKKIKDQIIESIVTHEGKQPKAQLKDRIIKLLGSVGLPSRVYEMFPHELSGGMKQRVCIAMAIALEPKLIIADEPTSALDVIVQRIIAQTLLDIKNRLNISMIMIGHDMGLMAQMADRIAVMYAGNLIEISSAKNIMKTPKHPYTKLLIDSVPSIKERNPVKVTESRIDYPEENDVGCIYRTRCPHAKDICFSKEPELLETGNEQQVACHMVNGEF